MSAHCHVRGGKLDEVGLKIIEKSLSTHSLQNQIDILLPLSQVDQLSEIQDEITSFFSSTFTIESCSLQKLLKIVLSLPSDERSRVSCIANHQFVDTEDSISISQGILHLKLTSASYYQSGLHGKPSLFNPKSGVSTKNNQFKLFKLSFDLINMEEMISHGDQNYTRLIWFSENSYAEKQFQIQISNIGCVPEEFTSIMRESKVKITRKDLGPLLTPDLQPQQDETWASETLEWITYALIPDSQLSTFDSTDSYISRLRQTFEADLSDEIRYVKIQISNGLFSGTQQLYRLFHLFVRKHPMFAMVAYGLKDVNISYGTKNEHGFIENGENNTVFLKQNNDYALWDVVAFGDPR